MRSFQQTSASGHCDMMWISRGTGVRGDELVLVERSDSGAGVLAAGVLRRASGRRRSVRSAMMEVIWG